MNRDSHIGQSGTEVFVDVGFQDWVEVLEFDVTNKWDYKYLVTNKRMKQKSDACEIILYNEHQCSLTSFSYDLLKAFFTTSLV